MRVLDRLACNLVPLTLLGITSFAGNTQAWAAADVPEREWRTAVDELVCPICGPLHQQRAKIGEAFPGNIQNPPAHPNCRCALVPIVSPERSPAPGTGQERRVVAGQERTFNVMRIGDTRTRLLVPINFDQDQQTWTPETLEATFARERAKLPEPLRDTVPEIVLTDERHTTLEDSWAQEYGFEPDQELNRITASTHLGTGSITIYQNSDLQEDPDWQGALVDLREELGHSIAVHLFGSPEPPQDWITAMQQDSSALGRNPAEDWAQAVALWLAGDLTAYPHREQVLRGLGFGTIKTV
jgi:hypothetical protein